MGILNVTPDSFSDGGQFFDSSAAIEHGLRLAVDGADLLDVGGESTRPYSDNVSVDEELKRVIPVIRGLTSRLKIPISVDTSKAAVARAALDVGAEIINDVSGLERDPEMIALAVQTSAAVCVMHMQGTPQTMQDDPRYEDVVAEVFDYLRARRDTLVAAGFDSEQMALDPGIGFGKSTAHNVALLSHCHRFHALGCPLLVGHSRKGFIAKTIGEENVDPLAGTIGVALSLAAQGVQVLRVHDVAAVRQALVMFEATGALSGIAQSTQ